MFHCTSCGTEYVAPRESCADCGGSVAEGDSPRYAAPAARPAARPTPAPEAPAPRVVADGPRPALPPHGLRHCPGCGAEFDGALVDCSDCGGALHPGPSPAFDAAASDDDRGSDALSPDDFVPLAAIDNGWQADTLCAILGDAGFATMVVTARGRRMRAPGFDAVGPAPAENERVEILVFPEALDEARIVLNEALAEQAGAEHFEQPADGPGTQCGVNCEHVATEDAGHPALAFVLAGVVVLVGVAAVLLWR